MTEKNSISFHKNCEEAPAYEKRLLDYSLDIICSFDANRRFVYLNAAAKRIWGYEPEELAGKIYTELVVPEDRPKTVAVSETIMQGTEVTDFRNRYHAKDGGVVPMLWSARWDQHTQTMYCVAKDATALQEAEEKAAVLKQRLLKAYQLGRIGWWEL